MKKILYLFIALFGILVLPLTVNAASTLLESIELDGFNALTLTRNTYTLNLLTTLDYEKIVVKTKAPNVTVTGDGNVPIKEGANQLVVTATDGTTTETYTINLNVTKGTGTSADGLNPATGAFVSVVGLSAVAVVGLGLFYFSRKKGIAKI